MTTDLITVRVQAPAIPEPEGNLDEVQANIDSLLAAYTGRVYTVDEIKSAKADRAQVNRWDKQLGGGIHRPSRSTTWRPWTSRWPGSPPCGGRSSRFQPPSTPRSRR